MLTAFSIPTHPMKVRGARSGQPKLKPRPKARASLQKDQQDPKAADDELHLELRQAAQALTGTAEELQPVVQEPDKTSRQRKGPEGQRLAAPSRGQAQQGQHQEHRAAHRRRSGLDLHVDAHPVALLRLRQAHAPLNVKPDVLQNEAEAEEGRTPQGRPLHEAAPPRSATRPRTTF